MAETTVAMEPQALLLTYAQVSRLLAVSERQVWNLVNDDAVPCVRIGKSVRIRREDVVAYIGKLRDKAGEN